MYFKRLCDDLSVLLPSLNKENIAVLCDEAEISIDQIIPVGLIVNELVTNAAKHGARKVVVAIVRTADGYKLSVSNDGAPLPANFDPSDTSGLGMKIVAALAKQLKGHFTFGSEGSRGAEFSILFPGAT